MNSSSHKFEVIHQTILDQNNILSKSYLCEIAGVSRSGYYRWLNAAAVRQAKEVQHPGQASLQEKLSDVRLRTIRVYWYGVNAECP